MSSNKHAVLRYRIIDRCLQQTNRKWNWKTLADECAEGIALITGEFHELSERTIKGDLANMRTNPILDYNAPIEWDRVEKTYFYSRPDFKLTERFITPKDKEALNQAVGILRQFGAIQELSGLQSALAKIQHSINQNDVQVDRIIQFDHPEEAPGHEWLHQVYELIMAKECINLLYEPFNKVKSSYRISPYMLKEFKYRWYLIGYSHKDKELRVYALDRVKGVQKSLEAYVVNTFADLGQYFDHIVGVTLYKDQKPKTIKFEVAPQLANYLNSSPIHSSQQVIEELEDRVIYSIKVIPNYELNRELLSYGSELKVISPRSLAKDLKSEIAKMNAEYDI